MIRDEISESREVGALKVLHVINSLSGSGGAEHGLVREVTRLTGGTDQTVVHLYSDDRLAHHLDAAGVSHLSLGLTSTRSGWNWPAAAVKLASEIRAIDPDVVHSSLTSANLSAQLATLINRVPVLSTFTLSGEEDLMRQYQPGAAARRAAILRRIQGVAARANNIWFRALTQDALITNSIALGVSPERAVVVPRGVETRDPSVEVAPRDELGLPPSVPLLLNVGRQTAQKGHVHLIETFSRVAEYSPAHLVVLGKGGDGSKALKEAVARFGLNEKVTIIEYTDRVSDFYEHASVFVFPSLMEGLGTAVLEAMAHRVPVVAFDIPPVREATDDGRVARLIPTGDITSMARAILECLHSDAPTHVVEAFEWVEGEFDLDVVSSRLRTVLENVAAGNGATFSPLA